MESDIEDIDAEEPLQPRMSLFEEYGPRLTKRMKKKLFAIQNEALKKLMHWFSDIDRKDQTAVIQMPTGSGKTGIIACLPYAFGSAVARKKIASLNLKKPMLIIAPGKVILDQLEKNLKSSSTCECFLKEREIIMSSDADDALYSVQLVQSSLDLGELQYSKNGNIVISNAQKFNPHPKPTTWRDLPDDIFSVVMVDEAHHLPSRQWEQIIRKFRQPSTKIIFFTATPNRADGRQITTDGALERFGPTYSLTREKAIEEGYIREVEFKPIPLEIPTTRYDPADVDKRIHYAILVIDEVVRLLEKKDKEHPLPGKKKHAALVITRDTTEATMLKEKAQKHHPHIQDCIAEVHSNVHKDIRKMVLEELYDGKVRIVIIVSMLLEGFDYPPISIAAIVTRIHSCVKFAQFVGRAQRVVRQPEQEERGIKAHIVTHDYFQQRERYEEYIKPSIPVDDDDKRFISLDRDND